MDKAERHKAERHKILILFEGLTAQPSEARGHIAREIEKHVDVVEYINDYSQVEDIRTFAWQVIDAVARKHRAKEATYSIVGYSFGGMVAQEAAKYVVDRHPEMHLDCVILIATTAPVTPEHPDTHILQAAVAAFETSRRRNLGHLDTVDLVLEAVSAHSQFRQIVDHPAVKGVLQSEAMMRLLHVGAMWILQPPTHSRHTGRTAKVIILVPEFDVIFPADTHIHRIQVAMGQAGFQRFEVVKLEQNDHGIEQATAADDHQLGAEFVGNCGQLGLDTKLKFLANNKQTLVSVSVGAFTLILTLVLIAAIILMTRRRHRRT